MDPLDLRELPVGLVQRIQHEAAENDEIYRRRPIDGVGLSNIHYGHATMLDWAFKQMPELKGARVLDIGVGEGYSSVLLKRAGAEVSGIDVSGAALERATELALRCGVSIDFRQMPGEDLRFDDASFDAILCMSAYHHMDLERATREFARVLRPGGRIVMIDPLASNPPAWVYRRIGKFFSREATSEEKPLCVRDLKFLKQYFRNVKWQGMFFLSVGLFGLDRIWKNENRLVHSLTNSAFRYLSPLDSLLLKNRVLQRIAWKIGIVADR